ncbi:hypothetical protein [Paenibacillus sp. FSL M7-1046]|uniref:hypothetical protein n=1 Tax=Paenibacillus sp. FSL M7-1046 TaxID=2975315 RepID=UPI0030FCD1B2
MVSKMVLSSFVTKSVKILGKERSAFAADAERTPFLKACEFCPKRSFIAENRTYQSQSRSLLGGFFIFGELI